MMVNSKVENAKKNNLSQTRATDKRYKKLDKTRAKGDAIKNTFFFANREIRAHPAGKKRMPKLKKRNAEEDESKHLPSAHFHLKNM